MKQFILLLHTFIVCSLAYEWSNLNQFQSAFKGYNESANSLVLSLESELRKTCEQASSFLSDLEDNSIVKKSRSSNLKFKSCAGSSLTTIDFLKDSFLVEVAQLEGPILRMIAELQGRLADISTSINVYQNVANNRMWSCEMIGGKCPEETSRWLEERILSLVCRVGPNCQSHSLVKRSGIDDYSYFQDFPVTCPADQFKCGLLTQEKCIPGDQVCNEICDCEKGCGDELPHCQRYCFGGFHCHNLRCVGKTYVCNGRDDCGDGSDEENCAKPKIEPVYNSTNCNFDEGKYLCSSRSKCLGLDLVCDGKDDCGDGSDESAACDSNSCPPGCSPSGGVCFRGPTGAVCLSGCPTGMSESPTGCIKSPPPPAATIAELLDDVPRLTNRHANGFKLLKKRVIDGIIDYLTQMMKCQEKMPGKLSNIIRLSPEHRENVLSKSSAGSTSNSAPTEDA